MMEDKPNFVKKTSIERQDVLSSTSCYTADATAISSSPENISSPENKPKTKIFAKCAKRVTRILSSFKVTRSLNSSLKSSTGSGYNLARDKKRNKDENTAHFMDESHGCNEYAKKNYCDPMAVNEETLCTKPNPNCNEKAERLEVEYPSTQQHPHTIVHITKSDIHYPTNNDKNTLNIIPNDTIRSNPFAGSIKRTSHSKDKRSIVTENTTNSKLKVRLKDEETSWKLHKSHNVLSDVSQLSLKEHHSEVGSQRRSSS